MFRSTKGASKHRRDLINAEVLKLRDMLPLSEPARQRLSHLQIMSLTCVYIRKCAHLNRLVSCNGGEKQKAPFEFSQSLPGFLMAATKDGKLLYVSENVIEYLGHSAVDMMTQGDTIFDITDKRDHATAQAQLLHGSYTAGTDEEQVFFCRMNVSRSFRRQTGYGDHKVMHVRGRFLLPTDKFNVGSQPIFVALCSPLVTPDSKPPAAQSTMTFHSVHALDMSYREVASSVAYHLGYTEDELYCMSWYDLVHPEDLMEARDKHKQLITSSHEIGCMLTIRLQSKYNGWVWMNIVMHVRQPFSCESGAAAIDPSVASIICANHVIRESEVLQYIQQSRLYTTHASQNADFLLCSTDSRHVGSPIVPTQEPRLYYQGELLSVPGMFQTQPNEVQQPILSPPTGCFQERLDPEMTAQTNIGAVTDQKTILRAGILNRLKRKVTEVAGGSSCKSSKQPRMSCTHDDLDESKLYQQRHLSYMGSVMSSGNAYGDAVDGGVQVFRADTFNDGFFGQLLLKKTVDNPESFLMQDCATLPFMPTDSLHTLSSDSIGMSPLTPDPAVTDVDFCAPAVVVPPSLLTPDASPAYSPNSPASPDMCIVADSSEQCVPSVWQDIEDALASNADFEMASVPVKKPQSKVTSKNRLPVLDADTLEDFLLVMEQRDAEEKLIDACVGESAPSSTQPAEEIMDLSGLQLDCLVGAMKETIFDIAQSAQATLPVGVPEFRQTSPPPPPPPVQTVADCQTIIEERASSTYDDILMDLLSSSVFGDTNTCYNSFFNDQTL